MEFTKYITLNKFYFIHSMTILLFIDVDKLGSALTPANGLSHSSFHYSRW